MRKLIYICLFLLILSCDEASDPLGGTCAEAIECDRLVLGSQEELADAPLCRSITSTGLHLMDNGGTRIHDLGGTFRCLTEITGGDLEVTNTDLTDLSAFSELESVHGDIQIWANNLMTTVAMENLESVGWGILTMGNDQLTGVDFPSLTSIFDTEIEEADDSHASALELTGLDELTSVNFPALVEVRTLSVSFCDKLTDLSGLESIQYAEHVSFSSNESLCSSVVDDFLDGITCSGPKLNTGNNGFC